MYKKVIHIILLSVCLSLGFLLPAYADAAAPPENTDTLAIVLVLGAAVVIIWVVSYCAIQYFKRKNSK